MANVNYDIRKGFFDKLLSGSTSFKTAISKTDGGTARFKLFYEEAPQVFPGTQYAVAPPYVVMAILPIVQSRDSAVSLYDCTVQFLVSSLTKSECENIAGYVTDLLEDCEASLTIGTYLNVNILRGPQINLPRIDNVYNIAVQYSITIQK